MSRLWRLAVVYAGDLAMQHSIALEKYIHDAWTDSGNTSNMLVCSTDGRFEIVLATVERLDELIEPVGWLMNHTTPQSVSLSAMPEPEAA